jgi:hypothetical protein
MRDAAALDLRTYYVCETLNHASLTFASWGARLVRAVVENPHELAGVRRVERRLEKIADETGTNRTDVIRQALNLMRVAREAKRRGKHLGVVADPSKLDTEIVGLL